MKFIIDREKYIDSGLVDEKEHPTAPLLIYNYTQTCQFSKSWDEVTMMCRGLIVHKDTREIVARPFKKFFNYEEHLAKGDKIPESKPMVYPKMDGSLGILYWIGDEPHIATRGSFVSDQAQWATSFIRQSDVSQWLRDAKKHFTYLFEIIYPENRIVLNYGGMQNLVLLAVIETETGQTMSLSQYDLDFPIVSEIPFTSYEELKKLDTPNEEGFVLYFHENDFRMKIKFETYVKLHKVMTGLSQIGIWEMMKDGADPYGNELPDEMFGWVSGIVDDLQGKFFDIEEQAGIVATLAKDFPTRKDQAEYIKKTKFPGISFTMLDGKSYAEAIWRIIRPKGQSTFRRDIDS